MNNRTAYVLDLILATLMIFVISSFLSMLVLVSINYLAGPPEEVRLIALISSGIGMLSVLIFFNETNKED